MKRENWNTLGNMFEIKTRGSFKKALSFCERHREVLQGQNSDPYIANVLSGFTAPHGNFMQAYIRWTMHTGSLKAAVQNLNETLLSINRKLKVWEGQIFFHYPEGSEEAKTLFPRKRTPFYKGSYILRTEAVKVLAKALGEYPVLAAVKSDVENFHTLLEGKLARKLGLDEQVAQFSNELEQQRKAVMTAMYGNLGLLMFHYREKPKMLKAFFDMGVLKNKVRRKKRTKKAAVK